MLSTPDCKPTARPALLLHRPGLSQIAIDFRATHMQTLVGGGAAVSRPRRRLQKSADHQQPTTRIRYEIQGSKWSNPFFPSPTRQRQNSMMPLHFQFPCCPHTQTHSLGTPSLQSASADTSLKVYASTSPLGGKLRGATHPSPFGGASSSAARCGLLRRSLPHKA